MRCGPFPCSSCGGSYGQHSESCPVKKARDMKQDRETAMDEMLDWFEKNKGALNLIIMERME